MTNLILLIKTEINKSYLSFLEISSKTSFIYIINCCEYLELLNHLIYFLLLYFKDIFFPFWVENDHIHIQVLSTFVFNIYFF